MNRNLFLLVSVVVVCFLPFSLATTDEGTSLTQFLSNCFSSSNLTLSWKTGRDPCVDNNWRGVVCEDTSVTSININGAALNCSLDPLVGLTSLKTLSLASNLLQTTIPDGFGSLPLEVLVLSNNKLFGTLPNSLTSLLLVTFDIHNNNLIGTIPALTVDQTEYYDLSSNNLGGFLPKNFGDFVADTYVNVSNNILSGNLAFYSSQPNFTVDVSCNNFRAIQPWCSSSTCKLCSRNITCPQAPPSLSTTTSGSVSTTSVARGTSSGSFSNSTASTTSNGQTTFSFTTVSNFAAGYTLLPNYLLFVVVTLIAVYIC